MAAKKKKAGTSPIESFRHRDTRMNIPTKELRDFVAEEEQAPKAMLYPRDPSLDPQLVWKGKDEQDRKDLAVPVVPIYIQEKIHPQALIQDLVRAKEKPSLRQNTLFADFNGIEDFDKKVDFYHHEQHWSNRLILGDSLLVMTSLAEKEGLKGKVQCIYFDPPYGIDFGSNWQVSTRRRQLVDGRSKDLTRQPEQIRAFRDTWKDGVHSYLSYVRDRLVVARDLLTPTGSIFLQIGDQNVHLVRSVLDEVFGSANHVVTITIKKKGSQKSSLIDPVNDYLLWYSKTSRHDPSLGAIKFHHLYEARDLDAETISEFSRVELPDGREFAVAEVPGPNGEVIDYRVRPQQLFKDFPGARLFRPWPITNGGERANQMDPIDLNGQSFSPPKGRCWSHSSRAEGASPSGMERVRRAGRLVAGASAIDFKRYLNDFGFKTISNWWDGLGGAPDPIYVVQTNPEIVKRCLLMTTDPGDLVLDPTCGSGTTAVVAEQWGRRWITSDTSRVALALARTRIMAACFPYYLLSDSPEGVEKEAELAGARPAPRATAGDVRRGFVNRRSAKITSGVIANNAKLDAIHDRWRPKLDGALAQLNREAKAKFGEWDVPRIVPQSWSKAACAAHAQWLKMSRDRQAEMDACIVANADPETLHDLPYEDGGRVRVAGPFTVESLSPHRVLAADENMDGAVTEVEAKQQQDFATMILDNLRKAGVQNTKKGERLQFDSLDPYPGTWIHAAGQFTDASGKVRKVAVSIGPEHGTVGPQQVKEAAKEAVKGVGFDHLIVCGFSFDSHVSEEAKRYGKLTVLITKMNPDLAMGDDLLKKTGAGNLFMVFGEPDVAIAKAKDGTVTVQVKGVDVYDPTTGQIRSSSTDDIACWFIDTDYNGESFFVRHAYFTGGDEPYEKLKRALRAEIDEAAWQALYSTKSRPFETPATGKIAVKVINHYGDEVMKVFEV